MKLPELQRRVPLDLDMCPKGGGGIKIQGNWVFESSGKFIGPKPDLTKINFASDDTCAQIRAASKKMKDDMPPNEFEDETDGEEPVRGITGEEPPKGLSYESVKSSRATPEPQEVVVGTPPKIGEAKRKARHERRKIQGMNDAPAV